MADPGTPPAVDLPSESEHTMTVRIKHSWDSDRAEELADETNPNLSNVNVRNAEDCPACMVNEWPCAFHEGLEIGARMVYDLIAEMSHGVGGVP